ncbi:MAG: iron ABC transporter permease [Fimbriimonadaceae bacterium]|nr:iron ABC transporter permease [Fimbriimonadaceae bacterium]
MSRTRRWTVALLWPLVGGVLLWLVVGPCLLLLQGSLHGPQGLTLEGYQRFLVAPPGAANIELEALWNSLLLGAGSVLLAALWGVPLALLFHYYDFPGRRVLAALAMVPVLLPPMVGVVSFYWLYGESGLVTRLMMLALGRETPLWTFRGLPAVLLIHAYSMYVYFYAFVTAGLQRLDASQVEAAATLGAKPLRRLGTVTLPLLTPALVGAALLVFMTSMASFTAPLMFDLRVLTTQLLNSRSNEDWLLQNVETVVLALLCIVFLAILRWAEGRGRYVGGSKGSGAARQPIRAGWLRYGVAVVGLLAVGGLLLPHGMVLLMSVADPHWTTQLLPPSYQLDAWRYVLTDPSGREPLVNSLQTAGLATLGNLLWAVPAAWLLTRFRFRGRAATEAAAMLPYAIPGTVVALALAEWFATDQPLSGRFVLVGTWALLPLAYFVRNLPLVLRAVQASLAQVDPSLEEAAATLGSGPAGVLRKIVLPLAAPGVTAGGLLAMIAALGEFAASWVAHIRANRPISLEMWAQLQDAAFDRCAAFGVLLVALVSVLLLLANRGRRDSTSVWGA